MILTENGVEAYVDAELAVAMSVASGREVSRAVNSLFAKLSAAG